MVISRSADKYSKQPLHRGFPTSKTLCIRFKLKVVQTFAQRNATFQKHRFYELDVLRFRNFCFLENMENIKNKTVLVTGGATGIGFKYAEEVLRQGAKAVAIFDLITSPGANAATTLEKEFGKGRAIFLACDVTNHELFKETFHKVVETFGGLDILINNAGILDDKNWQKTININLTALVNCCYVAFDYMGKHKGGKGGTIVNIASVVGLHPIFSLPVYSASKHGVVGFSRSIQAFYDKTGIRILVLCPGVTPTLLIANIPQYLPEFVDQEYADKELATYPVQTVEDVAHALVNLVQKGKNGSVWVIENGKTFAEEIPHYSKYSVPV